MQRQRGPGASESDPYDLYLIDPDGSNPTLVEAPPLSGWLQPSWFSPDGTMILGQSPVSTDTTDESDLDYVVTLDGSVEPLRIYAPGVSVATWQPVVNAESPLAWAEPDMTFSAPPSPAP